MTYPSMQDSGFPWLGEIPSHWRMRKFRHCFSESKETNGSSPVGEMLSISGYRGVEVRNYSDENQKRDHDQLENYRVVRFGQLAMNTMWLNYAGLGVSELEGHMSPAYRAYNFTYPLDKRYAHYLLRSSAYVDGYKALLQGVRPNSLQMPRESMMNLPILVPPLDEQRAIADYLDLSALKMSSLVTATLDLKSKILERHAALRRAEIRGDSKRGSAMVVTSQWFSQIPSNWNVYPLKALVSMKSGSGIAAEDIESQGPYPVFGGNGIRGFSDRFTHQGDCLLVGRQGALCGNVHLVGGRFWASEHALVTKPTAPLDLRWLRHLLVEMDLRQYSVSAAQPGLSASEILRLRVPIPPAADQQRIGAALDHDLEQAEAMGEACAKLIQVIEARRNSLISEVVTGKIDVKELARG